MNNYDEIKRLVENSRKMLSSNLNETSLRDLADVSSGSISLDDFYGKSAWEATGNEAIGTWPVVFGLAIT